MLLGKAIFTTLGLIVLTAILLLAPAASAKPYLDSGIAHPLNLAPVEHLLATGVRPGLNSGIAIEGKAVNSGSTISYTMQGDSLTVIDRKQLKRALRGWQSVSYSAAHGRSLPKGMKIILNQPLGQVVVVNLGTNDWLIDPEELRWSIRDLLDYIGPERCLVMATIYRYRPLTELNKIIAEEALTAGPQRFQVADWAGAVVADQVDLADGIHPREKVDLYLRAEVVAEAMRRCVTVDGFN